MVRPGHIVLILLMTAGTVLNGQYTKEFKRIFFDADYLMETGFYEEAYNRYNNLLTLDPGNSNILFHCGASSLNIPGKEVEAIAYLEEAVKGVTLSYKAKNHKEPGAPVMSYFLLGKAYHLDYQFEKAVAAYKQYLDNGSNQDQLQLEYTTLQIEACKRAAGIVRTRPAFEFYGVLEHFKEDLPSCTNPVISGDGKILIFLVDYPSDKKIMMSMLKDSLWSRPRVINSEIGMVGETYPVSISYDGKVLYLVHHFYSHSDIFVSRLEGNRWSEAEDLGYQINGRTSENHASISRDGKTLFFTSDLRGGIGSFDIYMARLNTKGEWDDLINLGPAINTPYEEHTPFISANDSTLFFSSQGHAGMGGLDVFFSALQPDGTWSEPENLGYPVNTTGDDLFYNPGWNQMESYYAVRKPDDPTSSAINMVTEIEYPEEEMLADQPAAADEDLQEKVVIPMAIAEPISDTTDTESSSTSSEEQDKEAVLVEPPNTDEIEMVLNDRQPEADPEPKVEPESEPNEVQTARSSVPPASATRSGYTDQLTTLVHFEFNEYALGLGAQLEALRIAELMMNYPDSKVSLTGHADCTGDVDFNMQLSIMRAEETAKYLEMYGINRDRIQVDGKGESAPLAINSFSDGSDSPLGRYVNRNVFVRISGRLPDDCRLGGVYIPEKKLKPAGSTAKIVAGEYTFTIQIMAVSMPLQRTFFNNLEVAEHACRDGLYRYTTGSFLTKADARKRLHQLWNQGYPDAFIQTRQYFEQSAR
jgi:outer membrane protein OmpA-like peptidoglycan-associated protein/tetratricopeptide (TPR) repeat protein